ncbi:STAS domain-containing protein [Streptomyces sp. NPDC002994]|uniref:STAS domain-containing protein n=1 Tax=Streptomyces sp. NPDC002994 TaxID=3154441 RepID=UPI0033ACBCCD
MPTTTRQRDNVTVVDAPATLDFNASKDFAAVTDNEFVNGATKFIINLASTQLIDSSGVGSMVKLYKNVRSCRGNLVLVGVHGQVKAILRLLRMDRTFTYYDSEDAAVAALS